ncbi:uncharacterized protein K460DRAFT_366855 [Cucurbitaria berberidis CBS 394.84]|uniref:Uncharacterized protein n=1 Tax=Cucurbitaria berberidis CBS 394.84 TaxID=1168544 RepID=A0A9P4GI46_9PLEO|nr:uncharacterized protein K460DRAFT_366855 [Cucurbitaria berberidis CBS 394.84]KAF1846015.1 hypothetical protein K460DRAFT_366855 [Cucurbitaria berberidis CBS 394.84]
MPPFGLYTVARHHQYGGSAPLARPVFNSMDFQDTSPGPAATVDSDAVQPVNETERGDDKMREKKEKKKKKHSLNAEGEKVTKKSTVPTAPASATPAPSSSKSTKDKDGKKESSTNDAHASEKKRKRESKVHADTPTTARGELVNAGSVLGGAFLQGLKSSMGDLSASFGHPAQPVQTDEKPSKKRKSSSKAEQGKTIDKISEAAPNGTNNGIPPGESVKKKLGRPRKSTLTQASDSPAKAPAPSVTSPYVSEPKHTPIPLPQKSPSRLATVATETRQKQAKPSRQDSEILVAETPPSQLPRTPSGFLSSPVPFSLSKPATSGRSKSKKGPTVHLSPSTSEEGLSKGTNVSSGNHASLTSSNLLRYTQPLNDEPKPRPRGRAASVATSTTSSASSMSIVEAPRVTKPYSRSGAEIDPFTEPEATKKKKTKHRETHDEATTQEFTAKFKASQHTVNFTDEHDYATTYLTWRAQSAASAPLPCLNKATGCNAKREQMLRLSREDSASSHLLSLLVATDTHARALADASARCAKADDLLALALAARVPVPLGRIEGTWRLFCPQYSATHEDKYGFGQRTLAISPIAGSPDTATTCTARLRIPPRSMAYAILPFRAPPHASFRSTTLTTSVEGYKVDVVFLGNGYLRLRMDLHLLLLGKPMEGGPGGQARFMEFVGVHDRAVRWAEEKDELEEEGRRLFAKYDGGVVED